MSAYVPGYRVPPVLPYGATGGQQGPSGPPGPAQVTARWATTSALPAYTISSDGATMTMNATGAIPAQDGVTAGLDTFLLLPANAAAPTDATPWLITTLGASGVRMVATRRPPLSVGAHAFGVLVEVARGAANAGLWACSNDVAADVVGTNALTWRHDGVAGALLAANNLSDVASASSARTNLGIGTAATQASSAFDAAGLAAAAQAAAIAASAQRASNLSDLASISAARTNLGLGSAATQNTSAFDAAGAASAALTTAEAYADAGDATKLGLHATADAAANLILGSDARGDLIYRAASAWLRRAIGAAGKLLRSDGTDPQWSSFTIPDTYTIGDLLYASASGVLSRLGIGARGQFFNANDGATPSWISIALLPRIEGVVLTALPAYTADQTTNGTLTANANGAFATYDGVAAALNNVYLVPAAAVASNVDVGVYVLTTLGDAGTKWVLTRHNRLWLGASASGVIAFVRAGTTQKGFVYQCQTAPLSDVVGTNAITFTLISTSPLITPSPQIGDGTGLAIFKCGINEATSETISGAGATSSATITFHEVDFTGNVACTTTLPSGAAVGDVHAYADKLFLASASNSLIVNADAGKTVNGGAAVTIVTPGFQRRFKKVTTTTWRYDQ